MASLYEEEILARYSTPGLRKNQLDCSAKKDQLGSIGIKGEYAEKILNKLYPVELKSNG